MNVEYVFPTVLGTDILNIDTSELDKIQDFHDNDMGRMSNNLRILELPNTKFIKDHLIKIINEFFYKLGYTKNKFVITTSWLNEIRKGGRILEHVHQNSFYSGLLYFQNDYSQAVPLEYRHPNRYTTQISPQCENPFHTEGSWIPPLVHNLLILFPSQIIHCSNTHLGSPRKSLAFNVMPTGFVGTGGDSVYDTQWLNS